MPAIRTIPPQFFKWDASGNITIAAGGGNTNCGGPLLSGTYVSPFGASSIAWSGRSQIYSPADGILRLTDNAGTVFLRLQFGGTTSSFPALRRSGASLDAVLADNSAYAPFNALTFSPGGSIFWSAGSGSPEGVVTAPVGSLYSRTNGGALTALYVKESGAGNVGWVAK